MLNVSYGNTLQTRNQIIEELAARKVSMPGYRVIDIGGSVNGWSQSVVDTVVDVNAIDSSKSINLDICRTESWYKLLAHVAVEGMYDYAICTHTLEDIYDPVTVLEHLPKIAHSGVITMPSIRAELSKPEHSAWHGYIHHRWIFENYNNCMLVIPKLEVVSAIVGDSIQFNPDTEEIIFQWHDDIPYKMFMDNYLGPNADTVISYYRQLIASIKC